MKKRLTKFAQVATLGLALTFTFSCSSGDDDNSGGGSSGGGVNGGSFSYEGKTYKTVKIGTQTWMAENLNYKVAGSKCYGEGGQVLVGWTDDNEPITVTLSNSEIQANCDKYGRLYDWATAMALPSSCNSSICSSQVGTKHRGICPSGWHIPSDEEWTTLTSFVGGSAGTKLKATSGWNDYNGSSGNGTDEFGFSALPGGYGYSNGDFGNVGRGDWWSATEDNASSAWRRSMDYDDDDIYRGNHGKTHLYSVRCVQD